MARSTSKTNHSCWAEFKCPYKMDNRCTFWDQVEVIVATLAESSPDNADCFTSLIDTLSEPCLELDEEECKRGVQDILELYKLDK